MSHDDDRTIRDVEAYLRQLAAVAKSASTATGTAAIASALAEAQRISARGLRSAVQLGRDRGLSWRELADLLEIPASTLHRQYHNGAAILAAHDSPPDLIGEPSAAGGMPKEFDAFVGRERELAGLADLLCRTRLLSVIGPVGVGKTRLAAELAARVAPSYPGGITWVDLAHVTRPGHVASAMGTAVRKPTTAGPAPLVFDNCEHVVDVVSMLRSTTPESKILVTSWEALRALGEVVMVLEPLHGDAVRLFGARALESRPDFDAGAWTDVIAKICDRLDDLPLAIEFAAHQLDVRTPESLLPEIAEPLVLLAGARRGERTRWHSLRDAIQ